MGAWRRKLGETLPNSRAVVVREWVRSLGGAVDAAGRVSRLPELGPGPVRDALLASIGHYGVAVAETEPGAPT